MVNFYIDTETYEWNESKQEYTPILNTNKFVMGAIKEEKEKTKIFTNKEEMKEWIKNKEIQLRNQKKIMTIYAHYANYDFLTIYKEEIRNNEWKIIRNDPLIATKKGTKLKIIDTTAKGDAEAIKIVQTQLSNSPQYIQYYLLQKWDGKMPTALGSNSILSITN